MRVRKKAELQKKISEIDQLRRKMEHTHKVADVDLVHHAEDETS